MRQRYAIADLVTTLCSDCEHTRHKPFLGLGGMGCQLQPRPHRGRHGTLCPHGGFLYPLLRWAPRLPLPVCAPIGHAITDGHHASAVGEGVPPFSTFALNHLRLFVLYRRRVLSIGYAISVA